MMFGPDNYSHNWIIEIKKIPESDAMAVNYGVIFNLYLVT